MKRKELLENSLQEEKNLQTVVSNTTKQDSKFLTREKRNLEDKIEDLKEQLEQRLSQTSAIDKSVIEVLYNSMKETEKTLGLYKSFESEFIG